LAVHRGNEKRRRAFLSNCRYTEQFLLGDHSVYFYDSQKERQNLLLFNLKAGLDRGCSALCIVSGENLEQTQDEIEDFGLKLDKPGKLRIVESRQWYTVNGVFHADRVIEQFKCLVDESLDNGFEGLYVSGDAADMFDYLTKKRLVKSFLEYERSLGRTFEVPIEAICAYRIEQIELNSEALLQLLQAHKNTITKTGKFIDNEKLCVETLTKEFNDILSEEATEAVFSFTERHLKISRNQIPDKMEEFFEALKLILGDSASVLIVQNILKDLYEKVECKMSP